MDQGRFYSVKIIYLKNKFLLNKFYNLSGLSFRHVLWLVEVEVGRPTARLVVGWLGLSG